MIDNFSRYPEVIKLKSTTSCAVITPLKEIFSIPEVLHNDMDLNTCHNTLQISPKITPFVTLPAVLGTPKAMGKQNTLFKHSNNYSSSLQTPTGNFCTIEPPNAMVQFEPCRVIHGMSSKDTGPTNKQASCSWMDISGRLSQKEPD